jgi:hypothetical protein
MVGLFGWLYMGDRHGRNAPEVPSPAGTRSVRVCHWRHHNLFHFAPTLEHVSTIAFSDLTILTINVLLTDCILWGASIATLIWAAVRLDPARVGILLMTEVIFGAVTSALFTGKKLSFSEIISGFLVLLCGLLEVLIADLKASLQVKMYEAMCWYCQTKTN